MTLKFRGGESELIVIETDAIPAISFVKDRSGFLDISEWPIFFNNRNIEISRTQGKVAINISILPDDRLYGLGEKPGRMNRKRTVHSLYNTDALNYNRKLNDIYSSFPSFIVVSSNLTEILINSGSKIDFDFGVSDYNSISIKVFSEEFEFFAKTANDFDKIMEWHSDLTGKPFNFPEWALEPQISRWSYYPQKIVEHVRDTYLEEFPLSAIYLDIDYMDDYRIFTWNRERFPEPERLIRESKDKGVRIVPIIDPGIKLDQNYDVFRKFIGHYVEDERSGIFTGYVWPGNCAFPDFLNSATREIWGEEIQKFIEPGIEALWLDMNEPSVKTKEGPEGEISSIKPEAVHKPESGRRIRHSAVHNFYSYFEAMATYEAMKRRVQNPFILSRSGYTGIQKYCALWTGDNEASYDDLLLQMSMVMSLSISGMPYAGCDLGGFMGNTDFELLCRYYEMALFFPIYRNHKIKSGNDQELYGLPEKFKSRIRSAIDTRYKFIEYLKSVVRECSLTGHPIIRPMFYHFYEDAETLGIFDQYMVGKDIIYAPQIYKGQNSREVYIPKGVWIEYSSGNKVTSGWIESSDRIPIFVSPSLYNQVKSNTD